MPSVGTQETSTTPMIWWQMALGYRLRTAHREEVAVSSRENERFAIEHELSPADLDERARHGVQTVGRGWVASRGSAGLWCVRSDEYGGLRCGCLWRVDVGDGDA
jgi:hypothetical protein